MAAESHAVYRKIREQIGYRPRETAFPNLAPQYGPLNAQYKERTSVGPGGHAHWAAYYHPGDHATNAEIARLVSRMPQVTADDNQYMADQEYIRKLEEENLHQRNSDFVGAMKLARERHAAEDMDRYMRAQELYTARRANGEMGLATGRLFTPDEARSGKTSFSMTTNHGAPPAGHADAQPYTHAYAHNHPFSHWQHYLQQVPPYNESARAMESSLLETNPNRLDLHPSAVHPARPQLPTQFM
eukprot:TRINITY_DN26408_c0_g1_i1.p1 TRINITY_DN26408_c0_g1~~TRINITY_DN26408_c0_g1_i1.p1  ORF type:complete len:243 (-),score=51.73 TRINITY_DN26408_c0_g1_i1:261-989(-)